MENRNGLLVDLQVTRATGTCEREAAAEMLRHQARKRIKPKTLGADKGYDTMDFVGKVRQWRITQLSAWFVGSAYNLLRMAKLLPQGAER